MLSVGSRGSPIDSGTVETIHIISLQDPSVAKCRQTNNYLVPGHPSVNVVGDGVIEVEPVRKFFNNDYIKKKKMFENLIN